MATRRPTKAVGAARQPALPRRKTRRSTALLKDAILQAAEAAGGEAGIVGYLTAQAETSPSLFMALLNKVLPMQGGDEAPGATQKPVTRIERVIVHPQDTDS